MNNNTEINIEAIREKSFQDVIKIIMLKEDGLFNAFVLFLFNGVNSLIVLKETISNDVTYYDLPPGFILNKIPDYHMSLSMGLLWSLAIIHGNKLLKAFNEIVVTNAPDIITLLINFVSNFKIDFSSTKAKIINEAKSIEEELKEKKTEN